jgi:hypothetical protein
MKCWICGGEADTGEHLIKASDIKSVFGRVAQNNPLYFHTDKKRNQKAKGIKASILKSRAKICALCNNQRTQPHDRAWEKLSEYLRMRQPPIKSGDRVKLHKVFPGSVKRSMLAVHLYFVKIFGCQIAEHNIPIDLKPFSNAILNNEPHPFIYIAVAPVLYNDLRSIGGSNVNAEKLEEHIVYAVWYYFLDRITVRIMYSEPSENRQGLINSWHPSNVLKCLRIAVV